MSPPYIAPLRAVRGAITLDTDSPKAMAEAVGELVGSLMRQNHIDAADIVSAFFTVTADITQANPATAIRLVRPDWQHVPMLCSQEPQIQGGLELCVRVLLQWYERMDHQVPSPTPLQGAVPVYLKGASHLRPDLT
ncbi:MAG: chorismate mutase [Cyanobacteria bacterium HKST-UBA06]|nr:chorismate mutase [Cyanobacteria bacterium HKST-UBA06]